MLAYDTAEIARPIPLSEGEKEVIERIKEYRMLPCSSSGGQNQNFPTCGATYQPAPFWVSQAKTNRAFSIRSLNICRRH